MKRKGKEKKISKAKKERKGRQPEWMREREHTFSRLLCNVERVCVCVCMCMYV